MRKIVTILLTAVLSLSCFSAFACNRGETEVSDITYRESRFEVVINNATAAGFTAWADDSTGSKTVYVNVGDKLILPAIKWDGFSATQKTNEDYEFLGWFYRDKDNAERRFDPNTAFTSENLNLNAYNVTLYAKVMRQWAGPY